MAQSIEQVLQSLTDSSVLIPVPDLFGEQMLELSQESATSSGSETTRTSANTFTTASGLVLARSSDALKVAHPDQ